MKRPAARLAEEPMKRRRENAELTMDLSIRRVWVGGLYALGARPGENNEDHLRLLHKRA